MRGSYVRARAWVVCDVIHYRRRMCDAASVAKRLAKRARVEKKKNPAVGSARTRRLRHLRFFRSVSALSAGAPSSLPVRMTFTAATAMSPNQ